MLSRLQVRCCNEVTQVQFNDTITVLCRHRFWNFLTDLPIRGVWGAKVQIIELRDINVSGKSALGTESDVKTLAAKPKHQSELMQLEWI